MWHNHLFSQRNKTSKIAVSGGEGWRQQERAVGENFKGGIGKIGRSS